MPASAGVVTQYQRLGVGHPDNLPSAASFVCALIDIRLYCRRRDGIFFFMGKLALNGIRIKALLIHRAAEHGSYTMADHFTLVSHCVDGIIDRIVRYGVIITALRWKHILGIAC